MAVVMFFVNTVIIAWNKLLLNVGVIVSQLIEMPIIMWNGLAVFLGYVWGIVQESVKLLMAIMEIGGGLFDVILMFLNLMWTFFTDLANILLTFNQAFDDGVNGEAFRFLPQCQVETDDWCMAVVGFQLFDQATAHTIVYPIVIVGITVATVMIMKRHIFNLVSMSFK